MGRLATQTTTTAPAGVEPRRRRVAVIEVVSAGLVGDGAVDAGLLQQGVAMRDAVASDLARLPGCSVGVAVDAGPAAGPGIDGWARVVVPSGATATDVVHRTALAWDAVWVIAPETGGLLAALCAATPATRWIGCHPAAIEVAASKSATSRCLHRAGLATPVRFASTADRWVVKPDDGAGAEATHRHGTPDAAERDLRARSRAGDVAVCEPWIDGEALSLSLLCHADGRAELLSVNRQEVDVDGAGTVQCHGVTIDVLRPPDARHRALAAVADAVADALPGLRGFVGIDLVWHAEHGPVVIEVNPRTTSAYVGLSAALGRNLAGAVVDAHFAALDQAQDGR